MHLHAGLLHFLVGAMRHHDTLHAPGLCLHAQPDVRAWPVPAVAAAANSATAHAAATVATATAATLRAATTCHAPAAATSAIAAVGPTTAHPSHSAWHRGGIRHHSR